MSAMTAQLSEQHRLLTGLAASLEAGQADSPLSNRGRQLSCDTEDPVRRFNLLTFGPQAIRQLFSWLAPELADTLQAAIDRLTGPAWLELTDSEWSIGSGAGCRAYPDAASWLDAVPAEGDSLLTLGVPRPATLAPLSLHLPYLPELLTLDVSAANLLAEHSPALLVAGPDQYSLTPEERGAYVQACAQADFVCPMILPPLSGQAPQGATWLQEAIPGHLQVLQAWRPRSEQPVAPLLGAAPSLQAEAIRTRACLDRTLRFTGLLDQRTSNESRSAAFQLQANEVLLEIASNSADLDERQQGQRKSLQRFKERAGEYIKQLQGRSRHNLAGQNVYPQLADRLLENLHTEDLLRSRDHKAYRLELAEAPLARLKEGAWQAISARHHDEVDDFIAHLDKTLGETGLKPQSFAVATGTRLADAENTLTGIDSLASLLDFKTRYRGEMQQRGFLKRLGEGRRVVFMLLMVFSLFGSMIGFNYRDYAIVGILFLAVFFGAALYTTISWKKDDRHQMQKELDKARDQIRMDLLRAISDVERERINRLGDWFAEQFQQLQNDVEDWRQASQKNEQQRISQARKSGKSKDEKLQMRIRELDRLRQEVAKAMHTLDQLDQQLLSEGRAIGFS